ncbi:uncharacterized protein K452DRAFT_281860 [Aplosporella prunicola CBS 121167]|uniref:Alpha/beta hydrolase fold-3 domain-containing protein n=1 Tax=Aplosporella prunicola CBS 121167 TaxID=1176127 RepID=A0A6A6AW87_9PEZI|nr:uncharacterized protein K452DRAFT_281860 [Aplosporella prunicola CBS 121167]KAF2135204.1 hypothetical protein K452DRAFT_281860 [Aplosporella prunicola CBS 121167]
MATEDWTSLAKVDPELEPLLPLLPPTSALVGDIATLRAELTERKKAMNAVLAPDSTGLDISETTITACDDYQIPARIYKPIDPPSRGSPLVVYLHGGGFCLGGLENEDLTCRTFAKNLGCTVLNIAYRLALEHPFPAGINDAWRSVKWAAANASELGANPSQGFVVGGTSAGGNMAAVIGTLARDSKLSPPLTDLCLLIPTVTNMHDPPTKYKDDLKSFEQNQDAPLLNQQSMHLMMAVLKPDWSSPLFNLYSVVNPVSRNGLPPTYIQVCGLDPLRDEGLMLEKELRTECKTPTKLQVYPGLPHSFWSFFPQLEASKKWKIDTMEGMKWLLKVGDKQGK